jgi:hypothetical protein
MIRSSPLKRSTTMTTRVPVQRKCKVCRALFAKRSMTHVACSPACAEVVGQAKAAKERAAAERADKRETREKLEAIKPRAKWLSEAQSAFNAFVRARDAHLPCVSCGRYHEGSWDAGHWLTTGARPELRFDEQNVHRQCVPCNRHLHGNTVLYRLELLRRIGPAAVERLEGPCPPRHYSIDDLRAIKQKYTALAREITNRRDCGTT